MVAQVILISRNHIINQTFDYLIPDELDGSVKVGSRVIVPFGLYNNSSEALVVKIIEQSAFERLKKIKSVVGTPVCSTEMLELCTWMQRQYLCSFYSAFKLVVPPKMKILLEEWISIKKDAVYDLNSLTAPQKTVMEHVSENGGAIEYNHLSDISGLNRLRASLHSLEQKGIVSISEDIDESIKELTVRIAKLRISVDDAYVISDELFEKRSTVQANILLCLADSEKSILITSELISVSDGNYAALNKLVDKGYIEIYTERKIREVYDINNYEVTEDYNPTDEQKPIIDYINNLTDTSIAEEILIRGVTGSGKTEIFLQTIKRCIKNNRRAIMLVPEIALTPQMVERFVSRFGNKVAVIHSGLSHGERFDQWNKIKNNEVDVVVGARSAIFAPLENIGLIIIDEEHETSYKSELSPRYHARDVAKYRAKQNNATIIMASATPSVDSFYHAKKGDYKLFEMNNRYNNNNMPDTKIVDMRSELFEYKNFSPISNRLQFEIRKNIDSGEKTILFLNRRGYNTFVSCRECGYVVECTDCSIPMTYHMNTNMLTCHYCGRNIPNITACPECGSKHIKFFGTGTQKIEDELKKLFPDIRILRMDRDTTSRKGSHEHILSSFKNNGADVLLGTQMVTKGLDFAEVSLVGVLAADSSLGVDDFRANEKTFSLLTQVCGRAGRGDIPGRAIIQTYQPKNSIIEFAKNHDYLKFYDNEINFRKHLNYPPFCDIINILVQGENENDVRDELNKIHAIIKDSAKSDLSYIKVTPPMPAPIYRIKKNYRYRILIKIIDSDKALDILHYVNDEFVKRSGKTNLIIDINPTNMS